MRLKNHLSNHCLIAAACFIFLLSISSGCSKRSPVAKKGGGAGATESSDPYGKVNVDDVLARTDYPKSARDKFETMKKIGRTEVMQKEVDAIIRKSLIKEPVPIEVFSRFNRGTAYQPSLSTLSQPLPSEYPEETINALDYINGKRDYMRIGVDHFLKKDIYGLKDADRKEIAEFMNSVIDGPEAEFNEDVWVKIRKQGEALLQRHAVQLKPEPMFNLCLAIAESKSQELTSASRRLDAAVVEFAKNDYPTRMSMLALRYVDSVRSSHRTTTQYIVRVAAMKHWLTNDFRARGIEERYAMEDVELYFKLAFLNQDWPALDEISYIVETSDTLPPWFKSMMQADYEFEMGYFHRGTGMAGTVTDEGWKKLKQHSLAAHKHYEAALETNPRFPESAVGLMSISQLGYSDEDEDHWFDKAIEYEFDFNKAYRARLISLMPRWGGSVEEMCKFAFKHAKKKKYESGVPYILPTCIFMIRNWGVLDAEQFDKLLNERQLIAETITALQGLLDNNKQYVFNGEVRDKKFLQTMLAFFMYRAGRTSDAERVFRELDGQHSAVAMKQFGNGAAGTMQALSAGASAFSAEYGEEAYQLQALMEDPVEKRIGNIDAIEELIGNISLSNESGGLYFERCLKQVRMEKKFADGEVVDINFDSDLNTWRIIDNHQLKYVSQSSAIYDNRTGDRTNQIVQVGRYPGPRMIQATFTFPDGVVPDPTFAPGLLAAAYNDWLYTVTVGLTENRTYQPIYREKASNIRVGEIRFGVSTGDRHMPPDVLFPCRDNRCELKFFVDVNYLEVYVGEQFLFRHWTPNLNKLVEFFAIQTNRALVGRGQVEISDLKVQKWAGPPPRKAGKEEVLEHYQKLFDADPDDKWNMFWLAQAKHANGDLVGALPLYKKACEAGVNKQIAGFYIGDILDRQGKRREAFDWYMDSALNVSDGGPANMMYAHTRQSSFTEPVNWSAFRARWLSVSNGFELKDKSFDRHLRSRSKLPTEIKWLAECVRVMPKTDDNEYQIESHITSYDRILKETPTKFKFIPQTIQDALKENSLFRRKIEDEPMYLSVEKATPFFRRIED